LKCPTKGGVNAYKWLSMSIQVRHTHFSDSSEIERLSFSKRVTWQIMLMIHTQWTPPPIIISLRRNWFLNTELREIFKLGGNFKLKLLTWDNWNWTLSGETFVSWRTWCSIVHTHADMSPQFYAVVVNKAVTIFINHMYVCIDACMYVCMYLCMYVGM